MSTSRVLAGMLGPMILVVEPISMPYLKGKGFGMPPGMLCSPAFVQKQSPKLLSRCVPLQGIWPRGQFWGFWEQWPLWSVTSWYNNFYHGQSERTKKLSWMEEAQLVCHASRGFTYTRLLKFYLPGISIKIMVYLLFKLFKKVFHIWGHKIFF